MHSILLRIGPVTIYSYGLMVALGFITAAILASREARKFNISADNIATLSLVILISGILGARALYVLFNLKDFALNPLEVFMVAHGGLIFFGGAISAFIFGLTYIKMSRMPFLDTADLLAPYIALGHSLGRIGCLLNGCCYGKPASIFLGVMFKDGVVRYPTQVYSCVYLVLLFILLRRCLASRKFKGQVFFIYLILYSAGRFCVEFIRGDNAPIFYNLTFSQAISLFLFIAGIMGLLIAWTRTR